jgi:DNA-binding Lrp family transcriptional regulator
MRSPDQPDVQGLLGRKMKMDETDKRLLKVLLENGVMHTVELAAALGVSEDEIVSRMMRLQEEGMVEGTLAPEGQN